MRSRSRQLFIGLSVIAFPLGLLAWTQGHGETSGTRVIWEYKIVDLEGVETLNQLGSEGWELVALQTILGEHFKEPARLYLKRAKS